MDSEKDIKETSHNDDFILSERDFYPPQDTRKLKSGIDNIYGGDNFSEYAEYLFEICDELEENEN